MKKVIEQKLVDFLGFLGALVIVIPIISVLLYIGIPEFRDWVSQTLHPSPLAGQLNEYINILPIESPDLGHPYLAGKIVIVDIQTKRIARVNSNSALDAIRANDPKEVGTIIWLDCQEQVVGTYGSLGTAYQTSCTLTVIDKGNNMIVGKEMFAGPQPPSLSQNGLDQHGGPPSDDDIVNYILSLPKR